MSSLSNGEMILDNEHDLDLAKAAQRCLVTALDHSKAINIAIIEDGVERIEDSPVLRLPPKALRMFAELLGAMAQGKAVSLVPRDLEISTQEAAMMLNVSRPHLVRMLEEGKIMFQKVGTHRRLRFANRPDLPLASLQKTATMMNQAIDGCLVQNFEELIPALTLPDPDDRHVLAAAIIGHADAIITFNLKDFPANGVRDIEVLHPDDFLLAQYELNKIKFLKSVKKMRERLRKPPKSAEELILTLEKQGLPQTAEILRAAAELI
ncbi:MAG: excisionase family DNA-binding protein [Burkholderiales bacterium]|nr:excisionase family DNA-binding protein [Burkholderiales bacterium]